MKRKKAHKSKARGRRPVVRGPQQDLFGGRTPRMRFIEKPLKQKGRPFVAFRAERGLIKAFEAWCKHRGSTVQTMLRAHMESVSGWEPEVAE